MICDRGTEAQRQVSQNQERLRLQLSSRISHYATLCLLSFSDMRTRSASDPAFIFLIGGIQRSGNAVTD